MNVKAAFSIAPIFLCLVFVIYGCKENGLQNSHVSKLSAGYVPGELIVKFKPEAFDDRGELISRSIEALNARYGVVSIESLFRGKVSGDLRYIYKLAFPEHTDIIGLEYEYSKDPFVVYAEPNYKAHVTSKKH